MLTVLGVTLGPVMNYCSLHRHDCWEVILNLSGRGEERLGDGRYAFFPGSVTVCPPGMPHMKDCSSGQMWQDLSLRFLDKGFSLNRLRFSDDFEQSLSKILHLMQTASARRESDGYCRALGEAVCALLREWDRRAPENALVERVQVELSRHFSDPEFSAGRALEKMDYCPDYLRRLFRQSTGPHPPAADPRLHPAFPKGLGHARAGNRPAFRLLRRGLFQPPVPPGHGLFPPGLSRRTLTAPGRDVYNKHQ